MKIETFIIVNKWASFIVIGALGPLVAGLGQWIGTDAWPSTLEWVVIVAGCGIGAATQNLSFLSQSFSDYKVEMKSTENGSTLQSKTVTVATKNEPAAAAATPPAANPAILMTGEKPRWDTPYEAPKSDLPDSKLG